MVDLIPNIECECSYELNPNPISFSKIERWIEICMKKKRYGNFEFIKQREKQIESIHNSTFTLQITKEDSKYMANCFHTCGI